MSPPLPGPAPASVGSSVVVAIVRVMFSDDGLGDDSGGVGVASSSSSIGTLASAGLSAAPPLVLGMSVLRCAGVTLKVHSLEKVCELTVGFSESHFISRSAMAEGCSLDSSMIS